MQSYAQRWHPESVVGKILSGKKAPFSDIKHRCAIFVFALPVNPQFCWIRNAHIVDTYDLGQYRLVHDFHNILVDSHVRLHLLWPWWHPSSEISSPSGVASRVIVTRVGLLARWIRAVAVFPLIRQPWFDRLLMGTVISGIGRYPLPRPASPCSLGSSRRAAAKRRWSRTSGCNTRRYSSPRRS